MLGPFHCGSATEAYLDFVRFAKNSNNCRRSRADGLGTKGTKHTTPTKFYLSDLRELGALRATAVARLCRTI